MLSAARITFGSTSIANRVSLFAIASTAGASPDPMSSCRFPNATFSFSVLVACATADPPNSFGELAQNHLLRVERLAGLDERVDLLLLLLRERHTHTPQRGDALHRIVQRLAKLDRGLRRIDAERLAHVEQDPGRPVEDVVALAGLVPDVAERQQHVLAGLDDLIVDAGLAAQCGREVADLLRGDVRRAPVDFRTACVCRATLLDSLERLDGRLDLDTSPAPIAAPASPAA
jgi:hypothetical protein